MSSPAPVRAPASRPHALLAHSAPGDIVARSRGESIGAGRFLADVASAAALLPPSGHVLNFCSDRYRFAVLLGAALLRGQVTLLPPTTTPNVIAAMRRFAPDAYYVSDDPAMLVDLPRLEMPEDAQREEHAFDVPTLAADQVAACVFTSGSTGEPQPHFKTWGALVADTTLEAKRFAIGPGHSILGTVPPQHMYGFESTVLLPLLAGAVLTAERLYYPVDIEAAIERSSAPRTLFTTPFHLRTWMESGGAAAHLERIVSATAPLSVALAREAEERTGAQVLEIYGCTEAGQVATRRPTRSPEWTVYDGMRVWNEGTQAMVGGGHVQAPTALMDVIEPLADGTRFLLHGRTADLVNVAGKRNSIAYLDHQLTAIPGVLDGAFYLPEDGAADGVTRLMAFVVAPTLDTARILAALRERIDAAFMPRPLVLVERLPRQLTGKLPREQLRALAERTRRGTKS